MRISGRLITSCVRKEMVLCVCRGGVEQRRVGLEYWKGVVEMQKPKKSARVVGKFPSVLEKEYRGTVSHLGHDGVWIEFDDPIPSEVIIGAVGVRSGSGARFGSRRQGNYFTWDKYSQYFAEENDD